MGTEEKLYKKIQQAAENAEQKDFPGMEKIWARVEDKLETQTLQKEKHLWKKLAVAASVVLLGTLAFFLLQEKETVIVPENTITTIIDSSKNMIPTPESANGFVNTTPEIKKNAEQILQQQIVIQNNIVINDTFNYASKKEMMIPKFIVKEEVQEMAKTSLVPTYNNTILNSASANDSGNLAKGKRYDLANSVNLLKEKDKKGANDDLVVIDGEANKKSLAEINPDEIVSVIKLKEPIYFINGVEYSEESLFGENPTSPYAPLSKQKIEKIEVIQPSDAVKIYGKKGEKGVVIISIKK